MKTMNMVAVTGNTYPVKDKLKELGAKWDKDNKQWLVPEDKKAEAEKLVSEASKAPQEKKPFVHHRCKQCGAAASRYNRIYRSGICGQCYQGDREEREMGY